MRDKKKWGDEMRDKKKMKRQDLYEKNGEMRRKTKKGGHEMRGQKKWGDATQDKK